MIDRKRIIIFYAVFIPDIKKYQFKLWLKAVISFSQKTIQNYLIKGIKTINEFWKMGKKELHMTECIHGSKLLYTYCDFKYQMCRYDKKKITCASMISFLPVHMWHYVYFTWTGVAWCLWTLRSWSGCPLPRPGWMDTRIKWRMRSASISWNCLSDTWTMDWILSERSVNRASTR